MELEDADFVSMVDELNLDYDEYDLKEVEADVSSKVMSKRGPWQKVYLIQNTPFKN